MSEYLSMLKSFDKDGDGQITEKGYKILYKKIFNISI